MGLPTKCTTQGVSQPSVKRRDSPADADPLDALWRQARPHLQRYSFTHSQIVTTCRVLLIKDRDAAELAGRAESQHGLKLGSSAFHGHFEGEDMKRFALSMYPTCPKSVFHALLGTAPRVIYSLFCAFGETRRSRSFDFYHGDRPADAQRHAVECVREERDLFP